MRWIDANKDSSKYLVLDDVPEVDTNSMILETPGFLMKVTDDWVSLSGDYSPSDEIYRERFDVPTGWVVEILVPTKYRKVKL